jgi:hypothetical protein
MEGTRAAAAAISTNKNSKNKAYLTLKEITPQWFERLNKILNENDEDIVNIPHRMSKQLNNTKWRFSKRNTLGM